MKNKGNDRYLPKLRFPEFENEWESSVFDKLFNIGSGKDYKHLLKGNVPVYGSGGYMLSVNKFLYEGESVCIGRKGTIDKPIFLTGKFWTVDTLFYTHSFKDCLPKFIFLLFQNINWKNFNEAGGIPSLSKKIIREIEVIIPEFKEQQKIADCLSSLDELITANNEKLTVLKACKKGLLQQLFPVEGEKTPKFRFPEFINDGDWEEIVLSDIADYENGKAHERNLSINGKYIVVNSKFISSNGEVFKRSNDAFCFAKKGDILMVLSDVPKGNALAKCFYVDKNETYTVNQRICKLTPTSINEYLLFYLMNRNSHFLLFDDGVKQTNLKKDDVLNCPLLIPKNKNLKEQKKIADCLISIDNKIEAQTKKIEVLKLHKKGLMQQLFPNVNDE